MERTSVGLRRAGETGQYKKDGLDHFSVNKIEGNKNMGSTYYIDGKPTDWKALIDLAREYEDMGDICQTSVAANILRKHGHEILDRPPVASVLPHIDDLDINDKHLSR